MTDAAHARRRSRPTEKDYVSWHEEYVLEGSPLHLRLLVVQDLLARALESLPVGPVRVISMCAGQGRDLLTVARRHPRGGDLVGRLVEIAPKNVQLAHQAMEVHGISGLDAVVGDAGWSDAYAGATPADLVLACGIFGNIRDEDVRRTIAFLPSLCATGAWVIWTRFPRADDILTTIQHWFNASGFRRQALVVPETPMFGVGAHEFVGQPAPFAPGTRLFADLR